MSPRREARRRSSSIEILAHNPARPSRRRRDASRSRQENREEEAGRRSPSIEVLAHHPARSAHRRRSASQVRREARRAFITQALLTDGFVLTGFRIV